MEVTEFGEMTFKASQKGVPFPQTEPSCQVVVMVCVVSPGAKLTVSVGPVALSERSHVYETVPPEVPEGTRMVPVKVNVIVLVQAP